MKRFLLLSCSLFALAGLSGILPAQDEAPDLETLLASLAEPVTIKARVGRDFTGEPIEVNSEKIILRTRVQGGEIEYTFARDDILGLRFPGNLLKPEAYTLMEAGQTDEALAIVDALYARRAPFFPFTGESEARYFAETIGWYRRAERFEEVLERIAAVEPYLRDVAQLARLEEETLLTLLKLERTSEARMAAEQWIAEAGREAGSALGWVALAQLELKAGDADAALFTLLEPIVFAGGRRVLYLEHTYSLAESIARQLGREKLADRLKADATAGEWRLESASWDPFPSPDFSSFTEDLLP